MIFRGYTTRGGELIRGTISENEAAVGGGIYWADADPEIISCDISDNLAYQGGGIFATGGFGLIKGCNIGGNFAGTSDGDVDDVVGQGGGIYCASIVAEIADCNIVNNQTTASGGAIFFTGSAADRPRVTNCIITYNQAERDGGGISVNWYAEPIITNCTLVNNEVTSNFGGVEGYGGGIYCSYHSKSAIINSIFWDNFADQGPQITVSTGFEFDPRPATLSVSYSDVQGGRSVTWVDPLCTLNWDDNDENISADPLFVTGPFGDYYLSQIAAGQSQNSPCVDAGSDFASALGMDRYTTRTDDAFDAFDTDKVDMGYHYPLTQTLEQCRFCDLNVDGSGDRDPDGIIDLQDLAIFALYWLDSDCQLDEWCHGADFNFDGKVDLVDFLIFADCWRAKDTEPPLPDPSRWAQDGEPRSVSETAPYSITMTAEEATDNWSWGIQYKFDCTSCDPDTDEHDSGWQTDTTYTVTSLEFEREYTFVVRARDRRGNEDANSEPRSAIAGWELNPPAPVEWEIGPDATAVGATSIIMTAQEAFDPEGHGPVEYRFYRIGPDTDQSVRQTGRTWVDTGLTLDVEYTYIFRVYDALGNWAQSDPCSAIAGQPRDYIPPYPTTGNPGDSALLASLSRGPGAGGLYYDTVTAVVGIDAEGSGVQYQFEELDAGPSVWLDGEVWQFGPVILSNVYNYRVRYRDQSPNQNESGWSEWAPYPPP